MKFPRPVIRVRPLPDCYPIPKLYGICYYRHDSDFLVMAWIPLNLLIRWGRAVWFWAKNPRRRLVEDELADVKAQLEKFRVSHCSQKYLEIRCLESYERGYHERGLHDEITAKLKEEGLLTDIERLKKALNPHGD